MGMHSMTKTLGHYVALELNRRPVTHIVVDIHMVQAHYVAPDTRPFPGSIPIFKRTRTCLDARSSPEFGAFPNF